MVPQALAGPTPFEPQCRPIAAAAVLELHALGSVPEALIGVRSGRAGQALHMQAFGRFAREEVCDRLARMEGRALPDECPDCGTSLHRDHNAARNIERAGQALRGGVALAAS